MAKELFSISMAALLLAAAAFGALEVWIDAHARQSLIEGAPGFGHDAQPLWLSHGAD